MPALRITGPRLRLRCRSKESRAWPVTPLASRDPSQPTGRAKWVETHAGSRAAALAAILLVQWLAVFRLAGELRLDADALLLLPVALACVYGLGALLGGPPLGVFAAGVWAFAPFAVVPLFDERYREIYKQGFLEQAAGLAQASGFRAAVALVVSAFFAARAVQRGGVLSGALAGAAAVVACALDSSASLFLPAPLLALVVARRWLAVAPLTVGVAIGVALAGLPALPGDWGNLGANEDGIREFFWSVRMLEWLPLAGVLGVARRSPALAVLLGLWFGAYLVVRGTDPDISIGGGTFFPALLPAFAAYALLVAAIPLLAPPLPSLRDVTPRRLLTRRSRA
jgi:hypothetical protein